METVNPINLSISYKYRRNMWEKSILDNVVFKLNDIIQFYEDNDYKLISNYRIIGAISYKFDKNVNTYLITEEKLDSNDKTIERSFNHLNPGEYIQNCWLSKERWATPQSKFIKVVKNNEEIMSVFEYSTGTRFSYIIDKGNGPSTIFFLRSNEQGDEVQLIEEQLLYYYKSHFEPSS